MRVRVPPANPFDEIQELAVAIRKWPNSTQLHVGLLYKADATQVMLCHLRTHFDFRNELPSADYRWLQSGLDRLNRDLIAAYCQLIVRRKDRIPFGFQFSGEYFSPVSGEYLRSGMGEGLTCSTFILAVHRSLGLELLICDEWPKRPDDIDWQIEMASKLNPWVGDAAARHIGDVRFRPEEVAAGVASRDTPLKFQTAELLAKSIVRSLDRSYPKSK